MENNEINKLFRKFHFDQTQKLSLSFQKTMDKIENTASKISKMKLPTPVMPVLSSYVNESIDNAIMVDEWKNTLKAVGVETKEINRCIDRSYRYAASLTFPFEVGFEERIRWFYYKYASGEWKCSRKF